MNIKQGILVVSLLLLSACSSSNFTLPEGGLSGDGRQSGVGQLDRTLYLRGDFTLWDAEAQYRMVESQPGVYSARAKFMSPGKVYEFKIADEKWSEGYNCGYKNDGRLELGMPLAADCNTVYNYFSFKPSKKGWYEIQFDYRNTRYPKVVIIKV
ncbi:hypothetical protein ACSLBF_00040 [Pseudoalteromonas sp. T1lg65]|uniref:hypothetical protein n=1 Tax=Pseudoalteromonas sp. T1lg65 TaxID=2077101 RepID=UPI003F7A9444